MVTLKITGSQNCLGWKVPLQVIVTIFVNDERAANVSYLGFKTFDTVSNNTLMDKLENIDKRAVKWIKNWLNSQVQRVEISGTRSGWR